MGFQGFGVLARIAYNKKSTTVRFVRGFNQTLAAAGLHGLAKEAGIQ
jgi:hypothetical protein